MGICELQITRNISQEQRIESRTNYRIWIELSKKIAFIDFLNFWVFYEIQSMFLRCDRTAGLKICDNILWHWIIFFFLAAIFA